MKRKIKIWLGCLLVIGIILVIVWSHCGILGGKNSNCVCFPGQLKKESFLMCDPMPCLPFYECISKEECESKEHYKIINGECIMEVQLAP